MKFQDKKYFQFYKFKRLLIHMRQHYMMKFGFKYQFKKNIKKNLLIQFQ